MTLQPHQLGPRLRLPKPHGAIFRSGDDSLAGPAERGHLDGAFVPFEIPDRGPGRPDPQARLLALQRGQDELAVPHDYDVGVVQQRNLPASYVVDIVRIR